MRRHSKVLLNQNSGDLVNLTQTNPYYHKSDGIFSRRLSQTRTIYYRFLDLATDVSVPAYRTAP